jgi:hypothetical protein
LTACDSKFVEPSPGKEKIEGISLDERVAKKTELDAKSDQIQRGAERIKTIFAMFRKVQNPSKTQDVYTPLDLLIDINLELKNKIPASKGNTEKMVRFGKVKIPVDLLSEACRNIDVMTESESVFTEKDGKKEVSNEQVIYSIKTCGSKDQYVQIFTASWLGSKMELQFLNKNLESVWNHIIFTDDLKNSTCSIKNDSRKILESIECKNFYLQLSESERAHVIELSFSSLSDPRFLTNADIYENAILKARAKMIVSAAGNVSFDLKKVE